VYKWLLVLGCAVYVVQLNNIQMKFIYLFAKNNTVLLINVVPFKVVCIEVYTATMMVMPVFQAFDEVHCVELSRCIP
jgi:hypothetical protein